MHQLSKQGVPDRFITATSGNKSFESTKIDSGRTPNTTIDGCLAGRRPLCGRQKKKKTCHRLARQNGEAGKPLEPILFVSWCTPDDPCNIQISQQCKLQGHVETAIQAPGFGLDRAASGPRHCAPRSGKGAVKKKNCTNSHKFFVAVGAIFFSPPLSFFVAVGAIFFHRPLVWLSFFCGCWCKFFFTAPLSGFARSSPHPRAGLLRDRIINSHFAGKIKLAFRRTPNFGARLGCSGYVLIQRVLVKWGFLHTFRCDFSQKD